jgi:hypothetical protein
VLLEWGGGGINLVSAIEDKNVSLTCWEFFVAKSVLLFNLLLDYTFSLRNKYLFKAHEIKSLLSVVLNFFI